VHKESAVNNLGNPTSKTDCSLNNEPNLLLPRIKVFSARILKEQKREWGGGESYLILGSDIIAVTGVVGR
jgi:hypothetical protein